MCQKKTSPDKFIIKKQSTHKLSNDLIDDIKKIKPIQNINFKDDGILKFIENNPLYDIINIYFKLHQKNKTLEAVKDLPEINEDSEESDEIDKLWFDGKILNKVITNYGKPSTTEEHKNIIEKYNKEIQKNVYKKMFSRVAHTKITEFNDIYDDNTDYTELDKAILKQIIFKRYNVKESNLLRLKHADLVDIIVSKNIKVIPVVPTGITGTNNEILLAPTKF